MSGGFAWVPLSFACGLRRLGFDVYFVEQIDSASCVTRSGNWAPFQESINREYFVQVMREFDMEDRSCLVCDGGTSVSGLG